MRNKRFLLILTVMCFAAPFSNVNAMMNRNIKNNSANSDNISNNIKNDNVSKNPKIYKKIVVKKNKTNKSAAPLSNVDAMMIGNMKNNNINSNNIRNNIKNNNVSKNPKIYKKIIVSKNKINKNYGNVNNVLKKIYSKPISQNKTNKNNIYSNYNTTSYINNMNHKNMGNIGNKLNIKNTDSKIKNQLENIMERISNCEEIVKKIPNEKEIANINVENKNQELEQIKKSLSEFSITQKTNIESNKIKEYIEIWLEAREISCLILEAMNTQQNILKTIEEKIDINSMRPIYNKIENLKNKDLTQYRNIIPKKYYEKAEQDIKLAKELYEELTSKYVSNDLLRHILDELANYKNLYEIAPESISQKEIQMSIKYLEKQREILQRFFPRRNIITDLQKNIIDKIDLWIGIKLNIYKIMMMLSQNDAKINNKLKKKSTGKISNIIYNIDFSEKEKNNFEKESIYYNNIEKDIEKAKKLIDDLKFKNKHNHPIMKNGIDIY